MISTGTFWTKYIMGFLSLSMIQLLDEQERTELSEIFQVKMEQAKEGTLDENYSTDALVDL